MRARFPEQRYAIHRIARNALTADAIHRQRVDPIAKLQHWLDPNLCSGFDTQLAAPVRPVRSARRHRPPRRSAPTGVVLAVMQDDLQVLPIASGVCLLETSLE
jgi:hypothetical protein